MGRCRRVGRRVLFLLTLVTFVPAVVDRGCAGLGMRLALVGSVPQVVGCLFRARFRVSNAVGGVLGVARGDLIGARLGMLIAELGPIG